MDSHGMRRFSAFFLGNCSMGRFPLQQLSKASMVPKPKPVCRNLNQNTCNRRRAMGVGTHESIHHKATVVGTMLVRATLIDSTLRFVVGVSPSKGMPCVWSLLCSLCTADRHTMATIDLEKSLK